MMVKVLWTLTAVSHGGRMDCWLLRYFLSISYLFPILFPNLLPIYVSSISYYFLFVIKEMKLMKPSKIIRFEKEIEKGYIGNRLGNRIVKRQEIDRKKVRGQPSFEQSINQAWNMMGIRI